MESLAPSLPELYPEMFPHEIPSSQLTPSKKTPLANSPRHSVTNQQRKNLIQQINYINSLDQYYSSHATLPMVSSMPSLPSFNSQHSESEEPYNFIKRGVIRHKPQPGFRLPSNEFRTSQVIPEVGEESDAQNFLTIKEALMRQARLDRSEGRRGGEECWGEG